MFLLHPTQQTESHSTNPEHLTPTVAAKPPSADTSGVGRVPAIVAVDYTCSTRCQYTTNPHSDLVRPRYDALLLTDDLQKNHFGPRGDIA